MGSNESQIVSDMKRFPLSSMYRDVQQRQPA